MRDRHAVDESNLVTIMQAAEIAGCYYRTVQRAIKRGDLQVLRRGPARRGTPLLLRRADVLRWAVERTRLRSEVSTEQRAEKS